MQNNNKKNLITAIDYSGSNEKPRNIYVLVSVEKTNIPKLSELLINRLRIKHWEKLRSREKAAYTNKFQRNWSEIKSLLTRVDIKFNAYDLLSSNAEIIENSRELIVDDSFFRKYMGMYEGEGKLVLESYTSGFRKAFIYLADNIANIIRRLLRGKMDWKTQFKLLKIFRK